MLPFRNTVCCCKSYTIYSSRLCPIHHPNLPAAHLEIFLKYNCLVSHWPVLFWILGYRLLNIPALASLCGVSNTLFPVSFHSTSHCKFPSALVTQAADSIDRGYKCGHCRYQDLGHWGTTKTWCEMGKSEMERYRASVILPFKIYTIYRLYSSFCLTRLSLHSGTRPIHQWVSVWCLFTVKTLTALVKQ